MSIAGESVSLAAAAVQLGWLLLGAALSSSTTSSLSQRMSAGPNAAIVGVRLPLVRACNVVDPGVHNSAREPS
jgi:hypothetical protein